jgi:hypothetical protein
MKPIETTAEALTHADVGKTAEQRKKFKPVMVTDRRLVSETDAHVGAGKDKTKDGKITALTLVELLYNAKLIDMNTLMAADRFRILHLEREGPSQGSGSYGDNPGRADPHGKADRVGSRQTWWKIDGNGKFDVTGKRPRQTNSYDYEAAMLAMCGVIDVEGRRVHDEELRRIMVLAITKTTDIQTQASVARLRTRYSGEKQLPPAGATVVTEALRRLVLHLRYGG